MSISIFKYVLTTHQDKLNSFWSNSITKSQGSSNKILMLSWLHPDSEYFSPSFHKVNICKYNSLSPKIRHTLIYWVSSKLEIIWEVRDWEITLKPLNWKAGRVAAGLVIPSLPRTCWKVKRCKNRVQAPVCVVGLANTLGISWSTPKPYVRVLLHPVKCTKGKEDRTPALRWLRKTLSKKKW